MNLRELELARRQAAARMRTGADCPGSCPPPELAVRPVNPNILPEGFVPRNWWVESALNPDGTLRAPIGSGGLLAIMFGATGFYQVNVPGNYALWALHVNYTSAAAGAVGIIQIGANNAPIRVLNGDPFDLDTVDFPKPLCGPVQVIITAGSIPGDPAVPLPVYWYAIIGELP